MMVESRNITPFFILGCVRSGTTMLRDILRQHPRLECPEETHFYRWADPFGSPRYDRTYITSRLFTSHRKLDQISEESFHSARRTAKSRKEIMEAYGNLYLKAQNNPEGRWFDKTPQNIYGIFLLGQDFPDAPFIHIHRNPLNVVASLKEGKVMARHDLHGAMNYWNESACLIGEYKKLYPERVLDIPYEGITSSPKEYISKIFEFIKEDDSGFGYDAINVHPEKNNYKKVLTEQEINEVIKMTKPYGDEYGYFR